MAADFTISELLEWARTKPADEEYDYIDAAYCAFGQFLRETRGWSELQCYYHDPVDTPEFDPKIDGALQQSRNFGALVARLEALLPAPSDTWTKANAYLADIEQVTA
jgi:hypothetical protein